LNVDYHGEVWHVWDVDVVRFGLVNHRPVGCMTSQLSNRRLVVRIERDCCLCLPSSVLVGGRQAPLM